MAAWKFETEHVTFGGNTIKVRELTDGERAKVALAGKASGEDKLALLSLVVSLGAVDPVLTQEDARGVPSRLLDKAAQTIMRLTGLVGDDTGAPEKKD